MCDQPCHLCSPPVGLERDGAAGLANKELSCVQKASRSNTACSHVTLPHFPASTTPTANAIIVPVTGMLRSSWTFGIGLHPEIILLWRHMEQNALDNHVHAKVFIISL